MERPTQDSAATSDTQTVAVTSKPPAVDPAIQAKKGPNATAPVIQLFDSGLREELVRQQRAEREERARKQREERAMLRGQKLLKADGSMEQWEINSKLPALYAPGAEQKTRRPRRIVGLNEQLQAHRAANSPNSTGAPSPTTGADDSGATSASKAHLGQDPTHPSPPRSLSSPKIAPLPKQHQQHTDPPQPQLQQQPPPPYQAHGQMPRQQPQLTPPQSAPADSQPSRPPPAASPQLFQGLQGLPPLPQSLLQRLPASLTSTPGTTGVAAAPPPVDVPRPEAAPASAPQPSSSSAQSLSNGPAAAGARSPQIQYRGGPSDQGTVGQSVQTAGAAVQTKVEENQGTRPAQPAQPAQPDPAPPQQNALLQALSSHGLLGGLNTIIGGVVPPHVVPNAQETPSLAGAQGSTDPPQQQQQQLSSVLDGLRRLGLPNEQLQALAQLGMQAPQIQHRAMAQGSPQTIQQPVLIPQPQFPQSQFQGDLAGTVSRPFDNRQGSSGPDQVSTPAAQEPPKPENADTDAANTPSPSVAQILPGLQGVSDPAASVLAQSIRNVLESKGTQFNPSLMGIPGCTALHGLTGMIPQLQGLQPDLLLQSMALQGRLQQDLLQQSQSLQLQLLLNPLQPSQNTILQQLQQLQQLQVLQQNQQLLAQQLVHGPNAQPNLFQLQTQGLFPQPPPPSQSPFQWPQVQRQPPPPGPTASTGESQPQPSAPPSPTGPEERRPSTGQTQGQPGQVPGLREIKPRSPYGPDRAPAPAPKPAYNSQEASIQHIKASIPGPSQSSRSSRAPSSAQSSAGSKESSPPVIRQIRAPLDADVRQKMAIHQQNAWNGKRIPISRDAPLVDVPLPDYTPRKWGSHGNVDNLSSQAKGREDGFGRSWRVQDDDSREDSVQQREPVRFGSDMQAGMYNFRASDSARYKPARKEPVASPDSASDPGPKRRGRPPRSLRSTRASLSAPPRKTRRRNAAQAAQSSDSEDGPSDISSDGESDVSGEEQLDKKDDVKPVTVPAKRRYGPRKRAASLPPQSKQIKTPQKPSAKLPVKVPARRGRPPKQGKKGFVIPGGAPPPVQPLHQSAESESSSEEESEDDDEDAGKASVSARSKKARGDASDSEFEVSYYTKRKYRRNGANTTV